MSYKFDLRTSVRILNIQIDNISTQEILRCLHKGVVVTPNVDHLMKLQKDPDFYHIYGLADYRVCDSQILLYASMFLGTPLREKISGSDLFPTFCNFHKDKPDIKIFLLGGMDGSQEKAATIINKKVEREIVVGAYSPPFGFESDEKECMKIVESIKQSRATVLAVGVGTPKSEKWIYSYKDNLPTIKIFMSIGATINFESGMIRRAPLWISNAGIEWLYRLFNEPRLWKRYFIDDLPFFYLLLKQRLNLYKDPFV